MLIVVLLKVATEAATFPELTTNFVRFGAVCGTHTQVLIYVKKKSFNVEFATVNGIREILPESAFFLQTNSYASE